MKSYHKRVLEAANTRMDRLSDSERKLVDRFIFEGHLAQPTPQEEITLNELGNRFKIKQPNVNSVFWPNYTFRS